MEKRLKFRIYKIITTTLQSCRSKDPSILPQDPVPSFSRPKPPPSSTLHFPPSSKTHQNNRQQPPQFSWQEDDNWHVVAKIYENNSSQNDIPFSQPKTRKNRRKKKKNVPNKMRISTSSADSEWFSEEETETLVSSSIDSSSSHLMPPILEMPQMLPHRKGKRRNNVRQRGSVVTEKDEEVIPARLSVFKRMIPCSVDGKVKESFAIVKRSRDPYGDFRDSMMDMVVEKQMFEAADLEQLLQCFLSLNSRSYHGVIVEAFSEIWEAIFCDQGSRI